MERLSLQLYVDRIGSDRMGWDGMRSNDLQSDSGLGQHSQFLQHLSHILNIWIRFRWNPLVERVVLTKRTNFQESSKGGMDIFNPKNYVAEFRPLNRAF